MRCSPRNSRNTVPRSSTKEKYLEDRLKKIIEEQKKLGVSKLGTTIKAISRTDGLLSLAYLLGEHLIFDLGLKNVLQVYGSPILCRSLKNVKLAIFDPWLENVRQESFSDDLRLKKMFFKKLCHVVRRPRPLKMQGKFRAKFNVHWT